jgi:hypothetical protein
VTGAGAGHGTLATGERERTVVPRILLRAHKDPFRVVSPEETLRSNLIGDNSGNLLFSHAAYKMLRTRDTSITTSTMQTGKLDAARINAEYDAVVLPLANAFRPSFERHLNAISAVIEKLTIPVTVLGVGAQLRLDGATDRLDGMRASTERFVRAVLERSPSIGVRGEFTRDYLHGLGFKQVEMIGCPSLFLNGADLRVEKRAERITRNSRISMNLSPYVEGIAPFVERHVRRYPNMHYIAQNKDALSMLLAPRRHALVEPEQKTLPVHSGHPLVAGHRTRFFVDAQPWLDYLSTFDFSFGTRIHGNIAGLASGVPSYVLAHDSRTLELARYFDIPHRTMAHVDGTTDAADLYSEADYTAFNAGHRERFDRFTAFLGDHGLGHVFQAGEDPAAFDRQVAALRFPEAVGGRRGLLPKRSVLRRLPVIARRPLRSPIAV